MDIKGTIKKLTAEEKAALVSGTDFMYTNPVPRLGISSLRMSDGPHGLRVQTEGGDNGVTGSLPATAFPTAACTASGWNEENLYKIGRAMAKECHKYGVHIVLGPGVNIKRNPLAGRNFEYFSEDPYLAGKLAAAEVRGIQSYGVGVSVKHFALNNSENYRFMGNSVCDMRAAHEIYLKAFEHIVKEGKPATLMCAYNMINGEYCSHNKWLLTDVLRERWGFDGLVMTDWGAMHSRVKSLQAGLDLEMPGDTGICRRWILDGIKDGTLAMKDLDKAVENVLNIVDKYAKPFGDDSDFEENDKLACEVAEDCAVLLKNDGVLPLEEYEELFVCGDLFERMRYQCAGSSMINPAKLTTPGKAFDDMGVKYKFARGYAENKIDTEHKFIDEAIVLAKPYKKVLVFAGLTDYVESEGCDREDMCLPQNQLDLIDALIAAGKEVIVVLFGGSPIEMPFCDRVGAILCMYLPGQSGGRACANLLFGRANPSGRLAETWVKEYKDVPFGENFGKGINEIYKESVFVGYRFYSTANKEVRYPFGYGLSYTRFEYSAFNVVRENDKIFAQCSIKNIGNCDGAEVVQLYVGLSNSGIFRPKRELKAFKKVYLKAGESAIVRLELSVSELAFFNIKKNEWQVERGEYCIEFCKDVFTPIYTANIAVEGENVQDVYSTEVMQVYGGADLSKVTDKLFENMSGLKIPALPPKMPVTLESRFTDLRQSFMGRILFGAVLGVANRQMKRALKMPEGVERDNKIKGAMFLKRILESNSLISMSMCAAKSMPYNFALGFMHLTNGHLIKGIKCFCTKIKVPALPKYKEDKS